MTRRSPTALRWWALPLGLLGLGLGSVVRLWSESLTLDMPAGLLIWVAGITVAATVPFACFALLARGHHRPPAQLSADGAAFTVPASPLFAGNTAIVWMFLGSNFVNHRVGESFLATVTAVVGVGVGVAAALTLLLVDRPRLRLDPHGLAIVRERTTVIAWDDLMPGGPPPPARRRARHLRLLLNHPILGGQFPISVSVPIGWLHVDPTFLANAIRYYAENPHERDSIGTEEGLRQLRAALATSPNDPHVLSR